MQAAQTLIVDESETIGNVGIGSLTVNGTHIVDGTLTVNPTGTLTVNNGGSLSFGTLTQAGGVINGTIVNTGSFWYQSGLFNGRLINQGSVTWSANFTAGNGIENDGSMYIQTGQRLTVNGQGLDNLGDLQLYGGTIGGSGPVINDYGGTLNASAGTVSQGITNNGTLFVSGLVTVGNSFNYGMVTIAQGGILHTFTAPNSGTFVNEPDGIVQAGGGVISMVFNNGPGGEVDLPAGTALSITSPWINSGLVNLAGMIANSDSGTMTNATLSGGAITNDSIIQGNGHMSAAVLNAGVINATGGELDLAGTGNTNTSMGQIEAAAGSTLLYLQGLATNSGTIALGGGTFDNGNQPLANASGAFIVGSGTLKTGGLTAPAAFPLQTIPPACTDRLPPRPAERSRSPTTRRHFMARSPSGAVRRSPRTMPRPVS